jgi:hypothetical protein
MTHSIPQNGISANEVAAKLSSAVSPRYECSLFPLSFFVAWSGVVVLVYDGFPPSFCRLKIGLESLVLNLKPENFGSKWPKTTLGAVQDTAADLTLEEFQQLKKICQQYSQKIVKARKETCVHIQRISIVEYTCRSLELLQARADFILDPSEDKLYLEASNEEKQRANGVVQEWEDESAYLEKVNDPGSRIGSYRQDSPSGATCVAFLDQLPTALLEIINDFRAEIEQKFPGRYFWMNQSSLHCTLRSLSQNETK